MTTASTFQIAEITRIKALRDRLVKAEELVRDGKVHPVMDMAGQWVVEGSQGHYLVNKDCTCPDYIHRTHLIEGYCKHRLAAMLYAEQEAPERNDLDQKIKDLYN
jgi:hypothetical protein